MLGKVPKNEAWNGRKGAGKRSLDVGGRVPESETWSGRKGAGKRGLEWEERCRKARLGVGGRVPESEAWNRSKRSLECGGALAVLCRPVTRFCLPFTSLLGHSVYWT